MLKKRLPAWLVGEVSEPEMSTPAGLSGQEISVEALLKDMRANDAMISRALDAAEATSISSQEEPDEPATDDSLRAAYLAAVNPYYADTAVLFDDMPDDSNRPKSLLFQLLNRPRLVACVSIAACIVGSIAYAGLGYWCLMSASPASATSVTASEPVAMLNVQDAGRIHGDTQHILKNIQALQDQGGILQPTTESDAEDALAAALPAAAGKQDPMAKDTDLAMLGMTDKTPELVGRADPFSPLVQANASLGSGGSAGPFGSAALPPVKRDPLEDVQYTGFIGDTASKDKVAILRISDPATGDRTLIKKAGDAFSVEGERVVINAISKHTIQLKISGAKRTLTLQPYVESVASSSSGNGGSGSGASNGSGAMASGSGGNSGGGSASGSERSGVRNPESPSLQEPR